MDKVDNLILKLVKEFGNDPDSFIKAIEDRFIHIPEDKKGDLFLKIGIRLGKFSYFHLAKKVFEEALFYYLKYKNKKGEGSCYINLGYVYSYLGDYRGAIEYLTKGLEISKEIEDKKGEGSCYINLGVVYYSSGDYRGAIEYYQKGLEISKEIGYKEGEVRCYINLGNVCCSLGNYKKAMEYYQKGLEINKKIGDKEDEGSCYINLGAVYSSLGDYKKAMEYYKKGLEIAKEIGDIYMEKVCFNNLGWTYLEQKEFLEAEKYFKEGIKIYEEFRRDKLPKDPKERKEFLKENIPLFDGMVICQVELKNIEKALEYSEMGKGRTILDFILYKGIEKEIKSSLNYEEIKDLAERIKRTIILFRITKKGTYVFIIKPKNIFEFISIPEFNDKKIREIMVKFDGNEPVDGWIYRYFKYNDIVNRYIADNLGGIAKKEAIKEIERERENWFNTLKVLDEELLSKVFEDKRFAKGEKIVIIPNKGLNLLPIHACQKNNGAYLIDEYEITYAPNSSLLHLCYEREEARRDKGKFFAIANPPSSLSLPFSEIEVAEIEKIGRFENKEVFIGKVVDKNLLREKISEFNIIHFSTHGIYDLDYDLNSRLLLGDGEDLKISEIFDKIEISDSWLVCLSACETGLTHYRDIADESIGLHTGFLYAGAPTVIATLWTVSDISSCLLMIKFYDNIFEKNMRKGEALREAQLWLRNATAEDLLFWAKGKSEYLLGILTGYFFQFNLEKRPFEHPYYWAGFQCFGAD